MLRKSSLALMTSLIVAVMVLGAFAWDYPPARKGDAVDDFHGTMVADPYRWLEDADSEETMAWVGAQNKLADSFLNTPAREKIKEHYTGLYNYPKYSIPKKKAGKYFYSKNDGLQDQDILYRQESLNGEPEIILDPNKLSEDGTVALTSTSFTKDATLMAYGLSASGSDWQTIHVMNIETGEVYDDVIPWTRYSRPAWKHDNSGFYYDCYPDPSTVPEGEITFHNRVYWHTLGTDPSEDIFIYKVPEDKELGYAPFVTYDGEYLVIYLWRGTARENGVHYRQVESDGEFIKLLNDFDAGYTFIGNIGSTFYFLTNLEAPRSRVIAIDLNNPERENWKEIIPEKEDVLSKVSLINNQFVAVYMHNAYNILKIYNLDGTFDKEIKLPTLGTIEKISGRPEHTEMFIKFISFLYPATIFRYDFTTGEISVYRASEMDFDPAGYITKQVFCRSRDGTAIPLFISHKEDLVLDGNNPVIMYGYGGFEWNMTPYFSVSKSMWMANGGIFAAAVLRGGNEYGEEWHRAGMLGNKQNVFDDYIACAEWLIENKYTNSSRLCIEGGSNGGLLVAVCMVQRPDLFGAVLCGAPVIDMLRYHKLAVGRWWTAEYGNAEEYPEHFKFLYAYSPLHNIKEGETYPPTFITTADTDDRVVPGHAKKFAAALQAADSGKNPILIRVETKAGHGVGKPTSKIIDSVADDYAFLFRVFDMKFTAGN